MLKAIFLFICLSFAGLTVCLGQPPSNDDFTNATVLSGNDISFTGNLTGATADTLEVIGLPFLDAFGSVQQSVWWSWTAAQSGPVTVAALSYSKDTYNSEVGDTGSFLSIYSITNDTMASGANYPPAIDAMWVDGAFSPLVLTFNASAGTTYQIQFADVFVGGSSLQVGFRLIATNTPVILEQPADQTIAPGGSAFFSVLPAGIQPFSYQWYSNNVAIPGANLAMLALDNVMTNQAAAYTVTVSNGTGTVTSQVANLQVSLDRPRASLNFLGQTTNGFAFSLSGQSGAYWRIESSSDLINWSPENSFPTTPTILLSPSATTPFASVVFTTNQMISMIVPAGGTAKFVRARFYSAPNEICNNNLKKIRFAKRLWVTSQVSNTNGESPIVRLQTPTSTQLAQFGVNPMDLICPVAGTNSDYNLQQAYLAPTCVVPGHVLEEPR